MSWIYPNWNPRSLQLSLWIQLKNSCFSFLEVDLSIHFLISCYCLARPGHSFCCCCYKAIKKDQFYRPWCMLELGIVVFCWGKTDYIAVWVCAWRFAAEPRLVGSRAQGNSVSLFLDPLFLSPCWAPWSSAAAAMPDWTECATDCAVSVPSPLLAAAMCSHRCCWCFLPLFSHSLLARFLSEPCSPLLMSCGDALHRLNFPNFVQYFCQSRHWTFSFFPQQASFKSEALFIFFYFFIWYWLLFSLSHQQ